MLKNSVLDIYSEDHFGVNCRAFTNSGVRYGWEFGVDSNIIIRN